LAASVLLKGPIGVVLTTAILIAERLITPKAERTSLELRNILRCALVVLLLAGPWFVAAHVWTEGEFTRVFFWQHNWQRAAGGSDTLTGHPWWTYIARLGVDPLPWSPLLIVAFIAAVRTNWLRDDSMARLGAAWLIGVTVVLSLSRFKRADYLLPAYPGLAILLGCFLERWYQSWRTPNRDRVLRAGIVSGAAAAVVVWLVVIHMVVPQMDADRTKREFAAEIREIVPAPEHVLLFRVEDHLLAFHLGRPINSFLEWENLDIWAGRSGSHFVVMPAECASVWRQYISSGALDEMRRFVDRTNRRRPRDLVLMRTRARDQAAHESGHHAPPAAYLTRAD
jgi:hypothetical protein